MNGNNQHMEKPKFNDKGMTQWYWRVLYPEKFKLGENVQIGSFTAIDALEGVEIEDNVKIGFNCVIISYSSIDEKGGKILLKRNCKIGSTTVIMPGITVGENSIVGANSFVNKNIPSSEVWVGTPAKFLKKVEKKN
ncbi:acyltransferase [Patescibacteria group bacterium]|nr:acyltransferase [Patescibacteria group bacterium]MCG2700523.1 acyltransferase [Candidatus Parcubacteria bacterium]